MSDAEQQEAGAVERWLCMGIHISLTDGRRGVEWMSIDTDGNTFGKPFYTDYKGFKRQTPVAGHIFEIKVRRSQENHAKFSYWQNTLKYIGSYKDAAQRQEWYAADLAREAEMQSDKEANKAKQQAVNEILETLKPLRRAYQHTNAAGRARIEVQLLTWLRKWNIDD